MADKSFRIAGRQVGGTAPTFVIAELSANHDQRFEEAQRLIYAAKDAGADAVKLQTYTPDTITINADSDCLRIKGTAWAGQSLHDLYQKAYMPWDWQPKLKKIADELGLILFSSPFDPTSVDFLEEMGVPAYKIASFELVDIPLIEKIAATGKPVIMSTGMGDELEIEEAVNAARNAGCNDVALLKCTSAYPSPPEEMNLRTIPALAQRFDVVAGLSDHTLGIEASVAAVALGARIIEKHFTLSRAQGGPDSEFSLEPIEFRAMVGAVRNTEMALGRVAFGPTANEMETRVLRRSLFVTEDLESGQLFTENNVRSIRPADGLSPKYWREVLGKRAACPVERGTPLSWEMIEGSAPSKACRERRCRE